MSGLFRGILNALGIRFNPSGNIAATNVQAAIEELDNETVKTTGNQTIEGNKTFNNTITFTTAQISGSAGSARDFNFSTLGSSRWRVRVNSSSESGSNAGSNFEFLALSDTGTLIDTPITIPRAASGVISTTRPVNITSSTPSTSTTTGSLTVAGGCGFGGNIFVGGTGNFANNLLIRRSGNTVGAELFINSNQGGLTGSATVDTSSSIQLEGNGGFGGETFRGRIQATFESLSSVSGTRLSFFTRASAFGALNENMVLKANGNLLLGTTTDNGADRLQVAGNVNATQYRLSNLNTAPASATASGVAGEIRVTATHIFVCVATNTWVRAALTTW